MDENKKMDEKDERTWAMLCHIGAFSGVVIPLGSFIVPLVIWLVKKEESSFVDDQGKESLNFQISIAIYAVILIVMGLILSLIVIGIFLLFLLVPLGLFWIIMIIIAGIKANEGEKYRYPVTIRLIK